MKRKKRKGRGHAKGAEFERHIAKKIVKAFKDFKIRQAECWRSVLSGGHAMSSGDLVMSEKLERLFPFCPEMKFWKSIEWQHFLISGSQRQKSWKEWHWLQQTEEGAKKRGDGLKPLLVMKCNREKIMVLVPAKRKLSTVFTKHWHYRLMPFSSFLRRAVRKAKRGKRYDKRSWNR